MVEKCAISMQDTGYEGKLSAISWVRGSKVKEWVERGGKMIFKQEWVNEIKAEEAQKGWQKRREKVWRVAYRAKCRNRSWQRLTFVHKRINEDINVAVGTTGSLSLFVLRFIYIRIPQAGRDNGSHPNNVWFPPHFHEQQIIKGESCPPKVFDSCLLDAYAHWPVCDTVSALTAAKARLLSGMLTSSSDASQDTLLWMQTQFLTNWTNTQ